MKLIKSDGKMFETILTWIIRNVTWAPNQHFRMISEGSCDTEAQNINAESSALPSQE